jgi:Flp pilus assembly protein TadD
VDSRRPWLAAASLAGLTLLAYLPSLRGGFIWDDDNFLTLNPLIKASDGLARFWFTTQATDYWPVTSSTLWLEWRLWGLNAAGYHATNLALHLIEVLLLWVILRRLRLPGALLGALLFAVHPVNVESVAWIAQRKNLVALLFFLLSIACFLKTAWGSPDSAAGNDDGPVAGDGWYWLSLLAFALAMLSKGSVAPLPVVLLGLIAWRRRLVFRDGLRASPFFAVAVALAAVNVWFQTHGSGVAIRSLSGIERLLGAAAIVWFYLGKALWPTHLIFIYPQWHISAGELRWWVPLLAAVALTGLLAWKGTARLRHGVARFHRATPGYAVANSGGAGIWRPALFAWGYFCVMLVPVLGFTDIAFMEYSPVANHYQHLAIIGVAGLAGAAWSRWHRFHRTAALAVAAIVVFALVCLTWRENQTYRNVETLYRTTLEENPGSWVAQGNLGGLLANTGRLPEAIPHFVEALRLRPDYPQARVSLGSALASTGHLDAARAQFEEALRLRPDFADGHYNLALVLRATGHLPEAAAHFREALRLKPNFPEAHNDLGVILAESGRKTEAIAQFEAALGLNPDYAEARANLGIAQRMPVPAAVP